MVDWKALFESWTQISPDLQKKIFDALLAKSPDSLKNLFMAEPYAKAIWNKIPEAQRFPPKAAAPAPIVPPAPAPKPVTPVTPVKPAPAPAAPPRVTKILESADMRRLQDLWNVEFFRALGKVPSGISSVFRVEFESVKTKSFDEAKEAILKAADELIDEIRARETVRHGVPFKPAVPAAPRAPGRMPTVREEIGGGEEENHGPFVPMGRVPPSQFPSYPLDFMQPFPRGPTSREQMRLWDVFCYQMQQQGFDCASYAREFHDYIEATQFLSWDDLRQKFKFFEDTIMKGQSLPPLESWRGLPLPTGLKGEIQELEALEKKEAILVHYSSVVIRNARSEGEIPTLSDLKEELVGLMQIPEATTIEELRDAAKIALTRALEKKDFHLAGITATEINDFLASS